MSFWMVLLLLIGGQNAFAQGLKAPNVAGAFYALDAQALRKDVDAYLTAASVSPAPGDINLAIVPHAGYVYSASTAAYVFKALEKHSYTTIVIIGASHYYRFPQAAIWPQGSFATPLGDIPVDEEFARDLMQKTPVLDAKLEVFNQEHSVEVQIPFIQRVWPQAKIVPILLGTPDAGVCEKLALALHQTMGSRKDVLVLVSTDLSHYLNEQENDAKDAMTLAALQKGDIGGFWDGNLHETMQMCGFTAVTTAMMLAKLRGEEPQLLRHANSALASGDRSRVVGYAALIYNQARARDQLNETQRRALVTLARRAVETVVRTGQRAALDITDPVLLKKQGAFVTLRKNGELRGCIGHIIGIQPLAKTVLDVAISAAKEDPRFQPVREEELEKIDLEVSVLSPPKRVSSAQEIQLGRDGVIVVSSSGEHQGVFLPQVAEETGWSKEEFLGQLCQQKAGLPATCYEDPQVQLYTFTAEVFGEK